MYLLNPNVTELEIADVELFMVELLTKLEVKRNF